MFQQPQLIASTGAGDNSQIHSGTSWSLSRQGKKKRSELVVAASSSGVAIYDLKSQRSRSVTSYGIPPGESVLCSPVSVVVRHEDPKQQERFTYWATDAAQGTPKKGTRKPKIKITCLYESGTKSKTFGVTFGSSEGQLTTVKALEILPEEDPKGDVASTSHGLILVHADCSVSRLTGDLKTIRLGEQLTDGSLDSSATLEFATLVPLEDARKTLLSSRADVLGATMPARGNIIVFVTQQDDETGLTMHCCHLDTHPTKLFSLPIPATSDTPVISARDLSLHSKSSRLYHLRQDAAHSSFAVYDLSGHKASLEYSMQIPDARSFLRLSQTVVALGFSDSSIAIYDVKWKSLLGLIPPPKDVTGRVDLLLHSPVQGTLVARCGGSLLSWNLRDDKVAGGMPRKRKYTGGLVDAIFSLARKEYSAADSKGTVYKSSKELTGRLTPSSSPATFAEIKARFDPLLYSSDPDAYDQAMAHALKVVSDNRKGTSIGYTAQPDLIAYALCGLFSYQTVLGDDTVRLLVKKWAPETFRFLVERGLCTVSALEQALRLGEQADLQLQLPATSIASALAAFDDSMQSLGEYVRAAVPSATELAVAALYSIQKLQSFDTSSDHPDADPMRMEGLSSTSAATSQENTALLETNSTETPHQAAHSVLQTCLLRLSLKSSKEVVRAFASSLRITEILQLIDHIRLGMASAGWLSRNLDADQEQESKPHVQTNQMTIAANVLHRAIDSLSTAVLKETTVDKEADATSERMAYMKAETSAALESVDQASTLSQILGQYLQYASCGSHAGALTSSQDITAVQPGSDGKESRMLPFGTGKPQFDTTKLVDGKRVQRSARDLADEESRKVGEYSFERIRF